MSANPERASTSPLGPLQRNISTAVGSVVKRCWSMKRSLMWWLARPSFVVSIGAACLRLTAQDVTVRPWNTSSKSNSPPKGRLLDAYGTLAPLHRRQPTDARRAGPNARLHLRPEAGATQERRLEAVRCKPWLGAGAGRDPRRDAPLASPHDHPPDHAMTPGEPPSVLGLPTAYHCRLGETPLRGPRRVAPRPPCDPPRGPRTPRPARSAPHAVAHVGRARAASPRRRPPHGSRPGPCRPPPATTAWGRAPDAAPRRPCGTVPHRPGETVRLSRRARRPSRVTRPALGRRWPWGHACRTGVRRHAMAARHPASGGASPRGETPSQEAQRRLTVGVSSGFFSRALGAQRRA